jgi:hypothetical protein
MRKLSRGRVGLLLHPQALRGEIAWRSRHGPILQPASKTRRSADHIKPLVLPSQVVYTNGLVQGCMCTWYIQEVASFVISTEILLLAFLQRNIDVYSGTSEWAIYDRSIGASDALMGAPNRPIVNCPLGDTVQSVPAQRSCRTAEV